jgi:hypothetical protein
MSDSKLLLWCWYISFILLCLALGLWYFFLFVFPSVDKVLSFCGPYNLRLSQVVNKLVPEVLHLRVTSCLFDFFRRFLR